MVGYIRPERTFNSLGTHFSLLHFPPLHLPFSNAYIPLWRCLSNILIWAEALISAINSDIEEAKVQLELPEHRKLKDDNFLTSRTDSPSASPPTSASTSQTIINGHWQPAVAAAHSNQTTRVFIIKLVSCSWTAFIFFLVFLHLKSRFAALLGLLQITSIVSLLFSPCSTLLFHSFCCIFETFHERGRGPWKFAAF